jgi:hypothetical protein
VRDKQPSHHLLFDFLIKKIKNLSSEGHIIYIYIYIYIQGQILIFGSMTLIIPETFRGFPRYLTLSIAVNEFICFKYSCFHR